MNCYFDHSATTPIDPEILEWIYENQSKVFGNPSSPHALGRKGKHTLEMARMQLAQVLECSPKEIIFTGSGTEANNLVLYHILSQENKHVITSSIEHPAILNTLDHLANFGITSSIIPVNNMGTVNPKDIEQAIQPDTGLITIMTANNEVGTIQPIETIGEIAQKHGVLFHTDGVQALGKIPLKQTLKNTDLMSFSSHKFYGPKGVGFLYKRNTVHLNPLIIGGGQESDLRGGTENIISIGAMALAAQKATHSQKNNSIYLTQLESKCVSDLNQLDSNIIIHGNPESHIPGLISFAIPGQDNQKVLTQLDRAQIYASSGSACHSGISTPSRVLEALGIDKDINLSTIRLSFGKNNSPEEVDYFIKTLTRILCS